MICYIYHEVELNKITISPFTLLIISSQLGVIYIKLRNSSLYYTYLKGRISDNLNLFINFVFKMHNLHQFILILLEQSLQTFNNVYNVHFIQIDNY